MIAWRTEEAAARAALTGRGGRAHGGGGARPRVGRVAAALTPPLVVLTGQTLAAAARQNLQKAEGPAAIAIAAQRDAYKARLAASRGRGLGEQAKAGPVARELD